MQIQLIRNATLRLTYAGRQLLVDPYLAPRHSRPSFTGKSPNPLVELPFTPAKIIDGAEGVFVSHLHSDHFDPLAQELLPRDIPLLCQPQDAPALLALGFRQVIPLQDTLIWNGITFTRTPCQHGSGTVLSEMGDASGLILQAPGEPTIYWAGDTVWCAAVAAVITRAQPDLIITHSCGAVWGDQQLIVMDAAQTIAVCRAAPRASVVAVHMEALDHATISRSELRAAADASSVSPAQLWIPRDGETLIFEVQTI